jgi:hypothetical protein
MKQVARGLAGYGRNGDNNLVHVSDQELRGIEQLTGRKFTRNPDTGLPEAFNFGNVIKMALPVVAGIAATALTGGAAAPLALAAGAGASGLTSAGIAAAEGKSTEQALTAGLISGVTSYAGGNLLSGVGEAAVGAGDAASQAVAAAAPAATSAPINTAADAISSAAGGMSGLATSNAAGGASANLASSGIGGIASANAGEAATNLGALQGIGSAAQGINPTASLTPSPVGIGSLEGINSAAANIPASGVNATTPVNAGSTSNSFSGNLSQVGDRFSNVISDPEAAISKLGSNIAANPTRALIAAGGTYAGLSGMGSDQQPQIPGQRPYDPNKYPEQFPTNPRRYNAPPAGYRAGIDPQYLYFAKGGLASMRQEGGMTENVVNEAKAALLGEHPKPQDALSRFEGMFGAGALEVLRDRITGGRVKGAGGGMDDLVPGTIEGRQKVRLADGEFVLPADIVSGIGDGSTDQGVRRLHEMMNKVRKERTGKTTQPKAIGGKISL